MQWQALPLFSAGCRAFAQPTVIPGDSVRPVYFGKQVIIMGRSVVFLQCVGAYPLPVQDPRVVGRPLGHFAQKRLRSRKISQLHQGEASPMQIIHVFDGHASQRLGILQGSLYIMGALPQQRPGAAGLYMIRVLLQHLLQSLLRPLLLLAAIPYQRQVAPSCQMIRPGLQFLFQQRFCLIQFPCDHPLPGLFQRLFLLQRRDLAKAFPRVFIKSI